MIRRSEDLLSTRLSPLLKRQIVGRWRAHRRPPMGPQQSPVHTLEWPQKNAARQSRGGFPEVLRLSHFQPLAHYLLYPLSFDFKFLCRLGRRHLDQRQNREINF